MKVRATSGIALSSESTSLERVAPQVRVRT
jgi:hypothetical protein